MAKQVTKALEALGIPPVTLGDSIKDAEMDLRIAARCEASAKEDLERHFLAIVGSLRRYASEIEETAQSDDFDTSMARKVVRIQHDLSWMMPNLNVDTLTTDLIAYQNAGRTRDNAQEHLDRVLRDNSTA